MKKLLLSLGAVAAVVAPVAAVVACGSNDSDADKTLQASKDLDIKTVNASKLSDTDKASAIKLINSAKTVDELTKNMTGITASINKANNGDAGTTTPDTTGTGTESGTAGTPAGTTAGTAGTTDQEEVTYDETSEDFITVGVHVQVKESDIIPEKLADVEAALAAKTPMPKDYLTPEFIDKLFNAGIAIQESVADQLYIPEADAITAFPTVKYELPSAIDMIVSKAKLKELGYDDAKQEFKDETVTSPEIVKLDEIIDEQIAATGLDDIVYANIGPKRIIVDKDEAVRKAEPTETFSRKTNFYKTTDITIVEFEI